MTLADFVNLPNVVKAFDKGDGLRILELARREGVQKEFTEYLVESGSFDRFLSLIPSIPSGCFEDCDSITSLHIPASVKEIGFGAFERCTSLKEIFIPRSVVSISTGAFERCTSLKEVKFEEPSSLTVLEAFTFARCKSLKTITIPQSITKLGPNIFDGCDALEVVYAPKRFKRFKYWKEGMSPDTKIEYI